MAQGLLCSLSADSSRWNGGLGFALALGGVAVVDLATKIALVLHEARMSKDVVTKIVKSIVEELALERVDLGLTWKILLEK